ncbi:MAG: hypothetical protein AAGI11_10770 [Pseudomonadota bacterium]
MKTAIAFVLLMVALPTSAQQEPLQTLDIDDVDTSYIYPAIMGTGTYKIDGRRLSMLTVPFSFTQQRLAEPDHELGLKWFAPVTIGYDQIDDTDWLDNLITEELVTLSVMPGAQVSIPLDETWTIRPYGQLGLGHDFVSDETFVLGTLGAKILGLWRWESGLELRWGAGIQVAGEYQFDSTRQTSFGLLETGVDVRKDFGQALFEQRIDLGLYYILQSYQPEWTIGRRLTDRSNIHEISELGVSVGLVKPRKVLGITVDRLRMGYKNGSGFKGVTFGTEFPF